MNYPKLTSAFLVLTHRCNLACRYCFVQQEKLDMSLQLALDSIDYVINNLTNEKESASIVFFGGEPLLRWDDIIVPAVLYKERMYPQKQCKFSITTNCVLLDEEKIRFMKEHNIGILTSIDGAKATQDYNRPFHNGQGSFDIVEKNLKLYKEIRGLDGVTFRSTIYPPTCEHIYENYLYAIEFGYKSMFFIADSFSDWTPEKENIVTQQLNMVADHYINFWKANKKAPISLNPLTKYMGDALFGIEQNEKGIPCKQKANKGKCGYGQGKGVAISPTGDMYGCQEMTSNEGSDSIFYIGNIYTGVLEDRRVKLKELFESTQPAGDISCAECSCKSICNSGCIANNYISTGDMNHATHGYCFFMRLVYDIDTRICRELRDIPEFINSVRKTNKNNKCLNCLSAQTSTNSATLQKSTCSSCSGNKDSCNGTCNSTNIVGSTNILNTPV